MEGQDGNKIEILHCKHEILQIFLESEAAWGRMAASVGLSSQVTQTGYFLPMWPFCWVGVTHRLSSADSPHSVRLPHPEGPCCSIVHTLPLRACGDPDFPINRANPRAFLWNLGGRIHYSLTHALCLSAKPAWRDLNQSLLPAGAVGCIPCRVAAGISKCLGGWDCGNLPLGGPAHPAVLKGVFQRNGNLCTLHTGIWGSDNS